MANLGTMLTIAQTLSAALENPALKDMCAMQDCVAQLEELKQSIHSIREVLLDVDVQQELPVETKYWVEKLKNAIYDADDTFDEFLTLAEQQKLSESAMVKLSKKVRDFFCPTNPPSISHIMAQGVENIRNKMVSMVSTASKVASKVGLFKVDYGRCCYEYEGNVLGREDDLKNILDVVLDPYVIDKVSFLTIVGDEGQGKSSLTKLMYDDERVEVEFPLRLWIGVCDLHGEQFDVKAVIARIASVGEADEADFIESSFLGELGEKKFLLVLDDLWNEDHQKWVSLRNFLMLGGRGSRVVVTTRSKQAARVIGNEYAYELKGLSLENSWRLFGMIAFDKGHEKMKTPELVEIGKKIVKKCAGVPLAIKVAGSLLFGQDISVWFSFEECELTNIREGENNVMSILKLSYHSLESHLKSCFCYCTLFPKEFVIDKQMLIKLWMAQGYIVPPKGGQNIEDVGEEYFYILINRCFLQPVEKNQCGEVVSCKIHSLMYDVAREVVGQDICVVTSIRKNMGDQVRHLCYSGWECAESSFTKTKIRSYLYATYLSFPVKKLVANWTHLRTLDLHGLGIETLPVSIGKLLHLRYLDLSDNEFPRLPSSFTKLHNLQTLNLSSCLLEDWPKDFCKLVNLRYLHLDECHELFYMPSGMDQLTSLHVLTTFFVADVGEMNSGESESSSEEESSSEDENSRERCCVGNLKDLRALTNLTGHLKIIIPENFPDVEESDNQEGYLRNTKHLETVKIEFSDEGKVSSHEALLEMLQPHPNVRKLSVLQYMGRTIPRWGREEDDWAVILPNLVKIKLDSCEELQHLSLLSKLQHLKSLNLGSLTKMEYIESASCSINSYAESSETELPVAESTFFPSLQYLVIQDLPNMKGWWREEELSDDLQANRSIWQPSFLQLLDLSITDCPELIVFPSCPSLETLLLSDFNGKLRIMMDKNDARLVSPSCSYTSTLQPCSSNVPVKLREVEIDNLSYLSSLPRRSLTKITIKYDQKVKSIESEVFKTCSSLESLVIHGCENLRSIDGGLKHLTSVESLLIEDIPELDFREQDHDDMAWRSLHNLRSLKLNKLDTMMVLPKGMQYLGSLQKLTIYECHNLKGLPEWISCLSSLQFLKVNYCVEFQSLPESMRNLASLQRLEMTYCKEGLKDRCQNPDGEDWHKIQHIPCIYILESESEPEHSWDSDSEYSIMH